MRRYWDKFINKSMKECVALALFGVFFIVLGFFGGHRSAPQLIGWLTTVFAALLFVPMIVKLGRRN